MKKVGHKVAKKKMAASKKMGPLYDNLRCTAYKCGYIKRAQPRKTVLIHVMDHVTDISYNVFGIANEPINSSSLWGRANKNHQGNSSRHILTDAKIYDWICNKLLIENVADRDTAL